MKDRVLRFDAANADATAVTDRETHSTWNAYGLATKGLLKGTQFRPAVRRPISLVVIDHIEPPTAT